MMTYTKKETHFFSNGNRIAAHLFIPSNGASDFPAIVIAAPQAGVKEQTVDHYATRLAAKGFVTLTFDHTSFGASEGEPRFHENPYIKSEDISNAVTFLSLHDQVQNDNIYGLGVCSGGGYLSFCAATDRRIKAMATVSAYFDHRGFYHSVMGRDGVLDVLKIGNLARETYLHTGYVSYLPHAPENDSSDMPRLFREFYEYYMTPRGQKGQYESKFLPWSFASLVNFSALDIAERLSPTPLLMIVGSEADSAYESEQMLAATGGGAELVVIQGSNHIGLYDVAEYVDQAVDRIAQHFA
ncbi:putative Hydrolase of the alpha/beta superfamily [Vibrio nigripulchritudo SO65]|uniref:alpha/beta hydrolase n=1 Tax=Vibrio nigripulchritudo TaxID=28173 RepID=UPI0003B243BF|nr:alpha/beta hydrolase [Vibrio nigripulchritudo]CCN36669.1 putative Hydrolase of the alpha/beta superfamily [Vibrio nigripulchritudo AM115]CCN43786.1 putative Hydrolase of the alpha/beta superfamily [Vibrio nigripulchritudo FTn2]CCN64621.1 putative Hydrolase of the alpha/beta superfamily [Vibrio nigripulchritudo POn4]CCN76714.1 putative Hydrolase of the alpha/beta superfamily [Vibrio nigripulchritudo SO65]